jgi:hypothetical protein
MAADPRFPEHAEALPIPHLEDPLPVLHAKLLAISKVVKSDKSVSIATNFAAVNVQERDATKKAVKEMPPLELESWEAYSQNRFSMPTMDWEKNVSPAPSSLSHSKWHVDVQKP